MVAGYFAIQAVKLDRNSLICICLTHLTCYACDPEPFAPLALSTTFNLKLHLNLVEILLPVKKDKASSQLEPM